MTFFGNCHHDWDYLMKLAEASGDWELYQFAKMMKEEEEKWEPKLTSSPPLGARVLTD